MGIFCSWELTLTVPDQGALHHIGYKGTYVLKSGCDHPQWAVAEGDNDCLVWESGQNAIWWDGDTALGYWRVGSKDDVNTGESGLRAFGNIATQICPHIYSYGDEGTLGPGYTTTWEYKELEKTSWIEAGSDSIVVSAGEKYF